MKKFEIIRNMKRNIFIVSIIMLGIALTSCNMKNSKDLNVTTEETTVEQTISDTAPEVAETSKNDGVEISIVTTEEVAKILEPIASYQSGTAGSSLKACIAVNDFMENYKESRITKDVFYDELTEYFADLEEDKQVEFRDQVAELSESYPNYFTENGKELLSEAGIDHLNFTKEDADAAFEVLLKVTQENVDAENSTNVAKDHQNLSSDSTTEEQEATDGTFEELLNGEGYLVASDAIITDFESDDYTFDPGAGYTINDLCGYFLKARGLTGGTIISYGALDHPGMEGYALLIQSDSLDGDGLFFIVSKENGEFLIKFVADCWSRKWQNVNPYGIIVSGGSNGAASHSSTTYVPDADLNYHTAFSEQTIGVGFEFYEETDLNAATVNAIAREVGESKTIDGANIVFIQELIDGKALYAFLGDNPITQDTVDQIDEIAAKHDFKFDGKKAIKEREKEIYNRYGITESQSGFDRTIELETVNK